MEPLRSKPAEVSEATQPPETVEPSEAYSEDGVDVSLIRWMLGLRPKERLEAAQDMIDTVWMLREASEASRRTTISAAAPISTGGARSKALLVTEQAAANTMRRRWPTA